MFYLALIYNLFKGKSCLLGPFWLYQVFPLLILKFSLEEQASLVWQFLCSIPVNMMAAFLSWMSSSVLPTEYQIMQKCLNKIVPEEKLLQQAMLHLSFINLNSIYI